MRSGAWLTTMDRSARDPSSSMSTTGRWSPGCALSLGTSAWPWSVMHWHGDDALRHGAQPRTCGGVYPLVSGHPRVFAHRVRIERAARTATHAGRPRGSLYRRQCCGAGRQIARFARNALSFGFPRFGGFSSCSIAQPALVLDHGHEAHCMQLCRQPAHCGRARAVRQ